MPEGEKAQLHALITGRVQGVGFRNYVQVTATGLGLTGWVRNLWDGSVEVTAEGERAGLEKLLLALQRGPSASRVRAVAHKWAPARGEFSDFRVKMTV